MDTWGQVAVVFEFRDHNTTITLCLQIVNRRRKRSCALTHRIYEQKGRAQVALGYNALVLRWPEIVRLARRGQRRSTGNFA